MSEQSTVDPPGIYGARVDFKAERVGWAVQKVSLQFDSPSAEAQEHLLALWRIWHREVVARANSGADQDVLL